jgi:S1-C subfamily serine protease
MRYVWPLAALLTLHGAPWDQEQATLRITITLTDAAQAPTPVAGYTLLVSDNPPTREPRRIRTTGDGSVVITLRPGAYTVESDRPAVRDGKAYQWTQFVDVAAGRDNTLALTAANAEIVPVADLPPPGPAEKRTSDAASLLARWEPSVVGIWSPTARASGFLVDSRGLIATDRQAIGAASSVEVQVSAAVKVPARVLASDSPRDVAIVWVDPAVLKAAAPVPLPCPPGANPALDEGDEISTITMPHLREKELEPGEVTALRPRVVETDLRLSFGGSGGPAFNESGTLVGLTSLSAETDAARRSDVNVVRAVFICDALAASLPKLAGAAPPAAVHLPIEPAPANTAVALDAAAKARAATPPSLSSAAFDVVVLTRPIAQAARERAGWTGGRGVRTTETEARLGQLTEFGAWSEYFSDLPPVVVIRVTPKLVEGFWKRLGREAARTQGAVLPPFKDFKTSFGRMRLTCGASEVVPIHPFVLEHRASDKNVVREGLYVFASDALGPHCDSATISLWSDPESKPETLTISRSVIDRIWQDRM